MKRIPLLFSLLLAMTLSIGQVWATDFTLSSADEVTQDGITVSFAKGEGATAPAWYSAGLRLYAKNTITISSSSTITGITFNWEKQGNKAFSTCTASVESYTHPSATGQGTWTGEATEIIFTLGDAGQLQLNKLSVTVAEGGGNADPVAVTGVALNEDAITLEIGETQTLKATITPSDATTKTVSWKSGDEEIATVDANGKITAVAIGNTTITVTTEDGAKTATCAVEVIAVVPKIVITQDEIEDFKNAYDQYTWTASSVSGKIYAYKNNGIQLNSNKDGYYIYNTDPIPGNIRKIKMTATGTARKWTPYVSTSALTAPDDNKKLEEKEVSSTTTWDVTGNNTYFYLTLAGGATNISSIVIEYEESGDQPGGGDEEETVYTVAGSPADVFGTAWAPELTDNEMTKQEDGTYKWEKTNVEFNRTSLVQFKVVEGHAWGKEYPNDNYSLNINEAGVYTITINFNPSTKEVSASATKTGEAQGGDDEDEIYTVAGSHADVFGTAWDPSLTDNEMTKQEDGTYKWEKADVELDTTDPIKFKVVVGHDWGEEYPTSNYELAISEAGIYTIAITFNPSTKEVAAAATKAGGDQPGGGDQTDDEEVTDKVVMKGFAGIETTGYQNQTKTGASENGIEMVAYAFNGATGQVRGNKTAIAGASVTTDDANKNWSLYNSEAMPGAIKKIEVTQTAADPNKFQNHLYVSLGKSSQGDVTTVEDAQVQDNTSDGNTITFTIDAAQGYTYFKLLSNQKFTASSVADVQVLITYVQNSGDQPGGGDEEETVYSVAGSAALLGTNWGETEGNEMTRQEDGTYKLVIENIELAHGNYEYKVVIDHKWNNGEAGSNSVLTIDKSGKYNVTFTYKPATDESDAETSATAELLEEIVVIPTVQLAGIYDDWWSNPQDMTIADDGLTASFSVELSKGVYYVFKVLVASTWLGNGHGFSRAENTATGITENIDNMYFIADATGIYTFTWTYADNSLTLTYPAAEQLVDGYYLVGSFYAWLPDTAYLFKESTSVAGEYILEHSLVESSRIKVAKVENNAITEWYPADQDDYVIDADHAGDKIVYFRPEGNTAWEAFHEGGFFFIPSAEPVEINTCAAAAEAAKALASGAFLNDGESFTLTGYVTQVVTAYNSTFGNLTFWMADTKDGGQVLQAYRVKPESADQLPKAGDLVEVTGKIKNYNGTPEFDAGGTCKIIEAAVIEVTNCATAAQAALSVSANNEPFNNGATYTLTGYVIAIDVHYSATTNNLTFWMDDTKDGIRMLQAYQVVPESADQIPAVGDKVEVTGTLTRYNQAPEIAAGGTCKIIEKDEVPPTNLGEKSIADFLALRNFKDTCIITGVVEQITDATNGIFNLVDQNDESVYVQIYGLLTADGQAGQFQSLDVTAGDILTIKAVYYEYNTKPEVKAAIFISRVKGVAPLNLGDKTIAEFLELKNTKDTCILTGVVANIVNTTYGNFDLTEIANPDVKVYVYGLLTAAGENKKFAEMNIAEGDTLTLKAIYLDYNGTIEAKNAIYVSHLKAVQTVEVNYPAEVYVDNVASEGWWLMQANVGVTKVVFSNLSTEISQAPGVYTAAELDPAYSYIVPDTTQTDTLRFVDGSIELVYGVQDTSALAIISGTLVGDDGANYAITLTYSVEAAINYYLVGDFNNWTPANDNLFMLNPYAEGEYKLNVNLAEGNQLKVVSVQGERQTWFPGGENNNFVVDAAHAGEKVIYFRPLGNSDWESFHQGGFFYIADKPNPAVVNITITDSITYLDNTQSEGWWQFHGQDDTYVVSLSNLGDATEVPGTYDLSVMDLSYTYVVVRATNIKILFTDGQGQVVVRQQGKTMIADATLVDADGNTYNIHMEHELTATALDAITSEHVTKFIENGRLVIERNGIRYDVTGQPLR